jgi:hypothetical protein
MKSRFIVLWGLCLALFCAEGLAAQVLAIPADSLVSIALNDGTRLKGRLIQETESHLVIETLSGLEVKVPKTSITASDRSGVAPPAPPSPAPTPTTRG